MVLLIFRPRRLAGPIGVSGAMEGGRHIRFNRWKGVRRGNQATVRERTYTLDDPP